MIATKEQELKALNQIKDIVEGLGHDSYIGIAFAGCFEDAENNIENDFANSMKDRWESAKREVERFRAEAAAISEELDKARDQIANIQKRSLSDDDITDCISLIQDRISEYDEAEEASAKIIVELADNPESGSFGQAVKDNRNAKRAAQYCKDLLNRLKRASTE